MYTQYPRTPSHTHTPSHAHTTSYTLPIAPCLHPHTHTHIPPHTGLHVVSPSWVTSSARHHHLQRCTSVSLDIAKHLATHIDHNHAHGRSRGNPHHQHGNTHKIQENTRTRGDAHADATHWWHCADARVQYVQQYVQLGVQQGVQQGVHAHTQPLQQQQKVPEQMQQEPQQQQQNTKKKHRHWPAVLLSGIAWWVHQDPATHACPESIGWQQCVAEQSTQHEERIYQGVVHGDLGLSAVHGGQRDGERDIQHGNAVPPSRVLCAAQGVVLHDSEEEEEVVDEEDEVENDNNNNENNNLGRGVERAMQCAVVHGAYAQLSASQQEQLGGNAGTWMHHVILEVHL